jgi:hypothetical protein
VNSVNLSDYNIQSCSDGVYRALNLDSGIMHEIFAKSFNEAEAMLRLLEAEANWRKIRDNTEPSRESGRCRDYSERK